MTMSTVEDCNAVIENLDGRVRISLYANTSVISSRCGCVCINMHLCAYIHFNLLNLGVRVNKFDEDITEYISIII